jgi:hypothetical protein
MFGAPVFEGVNSLKVGCLPEKFQQATDATAFANPAGKG